MAMAIVYSCMRSASTVCSMFRCVTPGNQNHEARYILFGTKRSALIGVYINNTLANGEHRRRTISLGTRHQAKQTKRTPVLW